MAVNQLIIQGTSKCNLNCQYCYISEQERRRKNRISLKTIDKTFELVCSSSIVSQDIQLLWHSGEPLTIPISFYEECEQRLKYYNRNDINIVKSIQSNGTLLTTKWIDFIKKHDYSISISCDGPAFLHNKNRLTWDNKETHDTVLKGIKLLNEHDIHISGLCVLTKESLDYPEDIFYFFKDHHFSGIGFNIEEKECFNTHSSLLESTSYPELLDKYKAFMKRLLDLASQYPDFTIRELEHTKYKFHKAVNNPYYTFRPDVVSPLKTLTIDVDGNMHTFCPEMVGGVDNISIGNVHTIHRLEEVFSNETLIHLTQQIEDGVSQCQKHCDYFRFCGGGRPGNKYFENGRFDSHETRSCNFHIKALIDSVLEDYESKQAMQTLLPGSRIYHARALHYAFNDVIMYNSGIRPVPTDHPMAYVEGAVLPKQDWQPVSSLDIATLNLTCVNDFDSAADLAIVDIPMDLKHYLASFELATCNTYQDILQIEHSDRFRTFLTKHLFPYFQSLSPLFPEESILSTLSYDVAGLETVSYNTKDNVYNGLHIDNWDRASTKKKKWTRNRICLNLGPSPRHFYFINLTFSHCNHLNLFTPEEIAMIHQNHYSFLALFFKKFSYYPVIKLCVQPLQAYMAPTDTIIHDGSSLECQHFDLSIMSLGHYKPPTSSV